VVAPSIRVPMCSHPRSATDPDGAARPVTPDACSSHGLRVPSIAAGSRTALQALFPRTMLRFECGLRTITLQ